MIMDGHSTLTASKPRPKYLDLTRIRQPVPAVVSILHRISGFALFLALPFLLYLFQFTLNSPEGFARSHTVLGQPLVKLILIGLLWAFFHHLFAGIRFLLLDVHVGLELQPARASSMLVLAVGILCALACGVLLW